jgi:hypothetical protein
MAKLRVRCIEAFTDASYPDKPRIRPIIGQDYTVAFTTKQDCFVLEEIMLKQNNKIQAWHMSFFKVIDEVVADEVKLTSPLKKNEDEEVKKKNEMWSVLILETFCLN